jgi:hypothetical protein
VFHFGGEHEQVTIVAIADGGRTVRVSTSGGTPSEFTLRLASGTFVARGEAHSPRLVLD